MLAESREGLQSVFEFCLNSSMLLAEQRHMRSMSLRLPSVKHKPALNPDFLWCQLAMRKLDTVGHRLRMIFLQATR